MPEGVGITVDGKELIANPGELVIDAAERHGFYIPRFCYHPRMRPVGMCRMCLVEIDTGRGPALQPSCMVNVAPDMKIHTASDATVKAQDGVLEFLLINHPLDCPVCDKGGECPLQDQTLAYGPGESRFIEEKRHFEKPIPISETVYLDRERCILCDRCTRFADEVAGDPLITFVDRGAQTQVNTFPDHPFASYFSGNTVQICPVGALTAKPYRFRARPWDLVQTESTCTSCSVGCRVVIDSSSNRVLRYQGVDIDPVNWGWLCDKGRFDFEAVHSEQRLGAPLVREPGGELTEARWSEALGAAADAIAEAIDRGGAGSVAVLGGSRLTNEDAYTWAKLAKAVIGTDHVDAQMGDGLPADAVLGLPRATIDEACTPGGTVLLLGPDLKEELPVLFLRLRHAVVNDGVRLIEVAPVATGATDLAAVSLRHRPGELAAAVDTVIGQLGQVEAGPLTVIVGRAAPTDPADQVITAAARILEARPDTRFLPALRRANVLGALDMGLAPGVLPGRVSLAAGRGWFEREGAWGSVPAEAGLDATGILASAADGRIETLVLLGADPLADFPDRSVAARALAGVRTVIACDQFLTESAAAAHVVLPAAGYAECGGTTTNIEGRISTLGEAVTPPGTARSDWMIAAELAFRLGADLGLESIDDIWSEIEALAPSHAGISRALLRSPSAADGVVAPLTAGTILAGSTPHGVEGGVLDARPTSITGEPESDVEPTADIAGSEDASADPEAMADESEAVDRESEAAEGASRSSTEDESRMAKPSRGAEGDAGPNVAETSLAVPARRPAPLTFRAPGPSAEVPAVDNYSLRLVATRRLYDRGTLVSHSPSLAGLAGPARLRLNPADFDRLGIGDGGRAKVTSARGSLTAEVLADPLVPKGSAAVAVNHEGLSVYDLIDATAPVTDIRVETV